jgi:hypothetical protein
MMLDNSLARLKGAIELWRKTKRYRTEPVPKKLAAQAKALVARHGRAKVARVTGLGYELLGGKRADWRKNLKTLAGKKAASKPPRPLVARLPSFSRLEIHAPGDGRLPLVEAETVAGLKLRVFSLTVESVAFLRSLDGGGGGR